MVKRTHIILVDFENVQPTDFNLLNDMGESFKLKIFLGPNQSKIDAKMAAILQSFGQKVEYVFVTKGGKNALDFFIAYELGVLSSIKERSINSMTYNIISKDTGFDPLIQSLKENNILIERCNTIGDTKHFRIKSPVKPGAPSLDLLVIQDLRKRKGSLPLTRSALFAAIRSRFKASDQQVEQVFTVLCKKGLIEVAEKNARTELKFNL